MCLPHNFRMPFEPHCKPCIFDPVRFHCCTGCPIFQLVCYCSLNFQAFTMPASFLEIQKLGMQAIYGKLCFFKDSKKRAVFRSFYGMPVAGGIHIVPICTDAQIISRYNTTPCCPCKGIEACTNPNYWDIMLDCIFCNIQFIKIAA